MTSTRRFGAARVLVGLVKNEIKTIPLETVVNNKKTLDPKMIELARMMD